MQKKLDMPLGMQLRTPFFKTCVFVAKKIQNEAV
jgi:hypothetical protein